MIRNIPYPKFYHTKEKTLCKVCRSKLLNPRDTSEMHKLKIRGFCGVECMYKDYEDLDDLTNRLYEHIDYIQSELQEVIAKDD